MFSKERLSRMRGVMAGYVDRGEIPGIVTLVSHYDDVQTDAVGTLAIDSDQKMQRDTIFRVASLTKPMTAAAVMILIEECKIRLDEPVDRFLPELANRRVLRSIESPLDNTVPAHRAITVRDLLTSRMGFGSVMAMPYTYPIQTPIHEGRLGGDSPRNIARMPATDEYLRRLGALPLMAQPGERFLYNTSSDVQGALIERVTEQRLGEFMQERIFGPLGMKDTSFVLDPSKASRLATSYWMNHETGELAVFDGVEDSDWRNPEFHSGSGGLLSTADDCHAFFRMMLNKGKLGSERILSQASVELMTSDQLTPENREGAEIFFGDNSSWGFGMAVYTRRTDLTSTPGRFGWTGGLGTCGYADPQEGLIGILLTQRALDSPEGPAVFEDFWTSAYQAVGD